MPAQYHLGAPPRMYYKTKNKCLQNIHQAKSIKDLQEIVERLINTDIYNNAKTCACYKLTIYINGSCTNNGIQDAAYSGRIWVGDDHHLNKAIKIPGDIYLNQIGEIIAILVTLQTANLLTPLKIITDSKYVINRLMTHSTDLEDK